MDQLCTSFDELLEDSEKKRPTCDKCRRPERVCWCSWLPEPAVEIRGKVIVLQHPNEEKRCLKTAPMLEHGIAKGSCLIYRGQKFPNATRHHGLGDIFQEPNCVLLYPGRNSRCLNDVIDEFRGRPYNLIVIDGTWAQAKSMYYHSPALHTMPQVALPEVGPSLYVVRTQPSENCLSTVESVTLALTMLEEKPHISQELLKPLQALCTFQLKHGAVEHHSKTVLLELGLYRKKVGKRTIKFLKKGGNDVSKYATKQNGTEEIGNDVSEYATKQNGTEEIGNDVSEYSTKQNDLEEIGNDASEYSTKQNDIEEIGNDVSEYATKQNNIKEIGNDVSNNATKQNDIEENE